MSLAIVRRNIAAWLEPEFKFERYTLSLSEVVLQGSRLAPSHPPMIRAPFSAKQGGQFTHFGIVGGGGLLLFATCAFFGVRAAYQAAFERKQDPKGGPHP